MIVRRVCAWCRTCYALVIWPMGSVRHDTHGACVPCAQAWRAEFQRRVQ